MHSLGKYACSPISDIERFTRRSTFLHIFKALLYRKYESNCSFDMIYIQKFTLIEKLIPGHSSGTLHALSDTLKKVSGLTPFLIHDIKFSKRLNSKHVQIYPRKRIKTTLAKSRLFKKRSITEEATRFFKWISVNFLSSSAIRFKGIASETNSITPQSVSIGSTLYVRILMGKCW